MIGASGHVAASKAFLDRLDHRQEIDDLLGERQDIGRVGEGRAEVGIVEPVATVGRPPNRRSWSSRFARKPGVTRRSASSGSVPWTSNARSKTASPVSTRSPGLKKPPKKSRTAPAPRALARKPKPEPDDPEQSKRFIDTAKEVEADSTKEGFEKAFNKVVPPTNPKSDRSA